MYVSLIAIKTSMAILPMAMPTISFAHRFKHFSRSSTVVCNTTAYLVISLMCVFDGGGPDCTVPYFTKLYSTAAKFDLNIFLAILHELGNIH